MYARTLPGPETTLSTWIFLRGWYLTSNTSGPRGLSWSFLICSSCSNPGVLNLFWLMCHNKIVDEVWSATTQMYIFLSISYYFLCFWTPFKCHKERFEVPHVALVPPFEEACNLTNSVICKHDTPFPPIFHVLQKVGGLNDVDLRTYIIWSWKLSLITWFIFKRMICTFIYKCPPQPVRFCIKYDEA